MTDELPALFSVSLVDSMFECKIRVRRLRDGASFSIDRHGYMHRWSTLTLEETDSLVSSVFALDLDSSKHWNARKAAEAWLAIVL